MMFGCCQEQTSDRVADPPDKISPSFIDPGGDIKPV